MGLRSIRGIHEITRIHTSVEDDRKSAGRCILGWLPTSRMRDRVSKDFSLSQRGTKDPRADFSRSTQSSLPSSLECSNREDWHHSSINLSPRGFSLSHLASSSNNRPSIPGVSPNRASNRMGNRSKPPHKRRILQWARAASKRLLDSV